MKKRHLMIVCAVMSCALLCCGCGGKGTAVLIEQMQEETGGQAPEGQDGSREAGQPGTPGQPGAPGQSEAPGQSQGAPQSAPQEQDAAIRVYVCGAVANPGVVEIPQGSRVEDALKAAGGFGPEAGREAVNLADWVSDGQRLYFPREGEAPEETQAQADSGSGLVNINTADAAALCTLPGIGESRARDIISYREANGGFETCEDIMKVSGIKTAAYEKIRDKITVK